MAGHGLWFAQQFLRPFRRHVFFPFVIINRGGAFKFFFFSNEVLLALNIFGMFASSQR
jgi:hypothetical protein